MWSILPTNNAFLVFAKLELNEKLYGAPFPQGESGDEKNGYSFYELIKVKDDDSKQEFYAPQYVTSSITSKPVLTCVTKKQFFSFKNRIIIAQPVKFVWKQ